MIGAAIATLAHTQDGVVATFQLRAEGITKDVLSRGLRSGELRRLHQGVFLVGDLELTRERRWRGGVLACGVGALLAYWSGATLWDLARDDRGLTHVIAPGGSRVDVPGIAKHRARNLHPEDYAEVNGIPVTSVARTLLDLAPLMRPARLARMLEDAERRRILDAAAVVRVCDRNRGHRGARRLLAALRRLGPVPDVRSPLERMFAEFCPRHGIPMPSFNVVVAGHVVDAVWQRQRLVVELDSWEHHRSRDAFEQDRKRDAVLLVNGYRVMRITWRRLRYAPAAVAAQLRTLLGLPEPGEGGESARKTSATAGVRAG